MIGVQMGAPQLNPQISRGFKCALVRGTLETGRSAEHVQAYTVLHTDGRTVVEECHNSVLISNLSGSCLLPELRVCQRKLWERRVEGWSREEACSTDCVVTVPTAYRVISQCGSKTPASFGFKTTAKQTLP